MKPSLIASTLGIFMASAVPQLANAQADAAVTAEPVRPFSAHYEASWKGI
ncbi:MAG: hypothetical protein QOF42_2714, partial [Gammaproteobacteria bacterium]|nr:hypothetical protein [Gammaproteobacteria bacterium]